MRRFDVDSDGNISETESGEFVRYDDVDTTITNMSRMLDEKSVRIMQLAGKIFMLQREVDREKNFEFEGAPIIFRVIYLNFDAAFISCDDKHVLQFDNYSEAMEVAVHFNRWCLGYT